MTKETDMSTRDTRIGRCETCDENVTWENAHLHPYLGGHTVWWVGREVSWVSTNERQRVPATGSSDSDRES